MANSKYSLTQGSVNQDAEQATSSDVTGFESYRAHHLRKIHIVMSLRPGDRNPLVCAVAGHRRTPCANCIIRI